MSPFEAVGTYTVHRPTTKRLDHGDFERSQITGEAETSVRNVRAFVSKVMLFDKLPRKAKG
jgi:hypothetical protein